MKALQSYFGKRDFKVTSEGIPISHPERVVDKSTGITKLDVVNHYLAVAKVIVPHLATRPVSLVRARRESTASSSSRSTPRR